jgi:hypothetical protein
MCFELSRESTHEFRHSFRLLASTASHAVIVLRYGTTGHDGDDGSWWRNDGLYAGNGGEAIDALPRVATEILDE